ncbi:hypothetical protein DXN05_10400 [Deminuibacter soli]|uniref:Peptidase S74 domain-containing protein n=2 Tax=Deminuibacter soli TaxID=2291815 RepID=A0A3E1NJI3_9BACT|nr:hypothetical protein DXN05_10400 [Deminuibacter soli]
MICKAKAQWIGYPPGSDTSKAWRTGDVVIGGAAPQNAKLTVTGNIVQTSNNNYFNTARLYMQSPGAIPANGQTYATFAGNTFWNNDSAKWQIANSDLTHFGMMRFSATGINFYTQTAATSAQWLTETDLASMLALTMQRGGNVGIGVPVSQAKLHVGGNGSPIDTIAQLSANMVIQASTGGRTTDRGAQLEFVLPSYSNGTNFWGQGRIITVAGDNIHGNAVGKMIIGTRRKFNKLGTGSDWYYGDDIVIDGKGNIGIGTLTPSKKFTMAYSGTQLNSTTPITSEMVVQASTATRSVDTGVALEFVLPANTDGTNLYGHARIFAQAANNTNGNAAGKLVLGTRRKYDKIGAGSLWYYGDDITIDETGNVGIGTLKPTGKLAVNGILLAKQVKVSQSAANWPDYVFTPGYQLPSLDSVAQYISENKHLPEMPDAKEVETNGQDVGKVQQLMLKKMEEMTLYMIDMQKRIDRLENENRELKAKSNNQH